jgi:hypothetical protein
MALLMSCKARFLNDGRQASLGTYSRFFNECATNDQKLPMVIADDSYTHEPLTRYWGRMGLSEFTSQTGKRYRIELIGSFVEPGHPPALQEALRQHLASSEAELGRKEAENILQIQAKLSCTSAAFKKIDAQLTELLQFVFAIYGDRKDFDQKLMDKLQMDSRGILRTSVYAAIREVIGSDNAEQSELVAVIRIARAPYGRRYVLKAGAPRDADPVEEDSGNFGPIFRTLIPELWSGHVGQHGSPLEGKDNFAEFDPSRAAYLRTYTRPWDPKKPLVYLTHAMAARQLTQQRSERTKFVSLPMEQSLGIKLPREAPGRRAASESAAESEKRRATAGGAGPKDVDVYYSAGELMEIGSYAIKKGYSEEVRLQLYLEFARLMQTLTKTHHVRLWNRSNSPRLYKVLGFEEVGPSVTDNYGTWTIQMTDAAKLVASLGLIVNKLAEKQLTLEETTAVNSEVDGWEREWRAQNGNQ